MFNSPGSVLGFLAGVALTVGLLLSPHLVPGGWGYGMALGWSGPQVALLLAGYGAILALTLFAAGRLIRNAESWKQGRVIAGAVLIAFVANDLYVTLVEFFMLKSGMRALIAVLGVPVIYGNLSAVLGKTDLKTAMLNLLSGAFATVGAGFIIAALVKGW